MATLHKEIRDFLAGLGLTPTETSLYATGLQFGPQTTAELAKRAGLKRTTAHSALLSLEQKGLAGLHTQTGTSYFHMKDPNLIEKGFAEKIESIQKQHLDFINLLPLFDSLSTQKTSTTEVACYYGEEGVHTVIDTALYCATKEWKIIAPERNFFSDGNKEYSDYFIRIRKQRGIKAKSLWEESFVKKRTFDITAFEFRNPRMLPKALEGKFKNMLIMFDTSVAFVGSANDGSAVLIRSAEIHNTMEVFFDGLWESARPIPKRNIKN